MLKNKKLRLIISMSLLSCSLLFQSCMNFKNIGGDLGEGLLDELDNRSDTITYKLGKGLIDGLTDELTRYETQKKLSIALDSLFMRLGYSVNRETVALRDSLLGDVTRKWIQDVRDDLLGAGTRKHAALLRDELLGMNTLRHIMNMRNELLGYNTSTRLRTLIEEVLSDTTIGRVGKLRDELLGERTKGALASIVDSAMVSLISRYRSGLQPELQGDLTFLQRNITWILITIGVIVIVIIGFVWQKKEKYAKLTALLANQIHQVPQDGEFETLKKNISSKAKEEKLEPLLRELLTEYGILGDEKRAKLSI